MSNPETFPSDKTYRVFVIHMIGTAVLLESGVTRERAEQLKSALAGLFKRVVIAEVPTDFGKSDRPLA